MGIICFDDTESIHLARVLRANAGFRFVGFDGTGRIWICEVLGVKRSEVTARVVESLIEPPRKLRITVGVATVKAARMDWAVEKAAELGASLFVPLETRYSVVEPGSGKVKRWRTIALSAAKQIGLARIMGIAEPIPVLKYLKQLAETSPETTLLLLDEKEETAALQTVWAAHRTDSVVILIGPEGGWSKEERSALQAAGAHSVSIGRNIVRTETAVVVGLGLLAQSEWEAR